MTKLEAVVVAGAGLSGPASMARLSERASQVRIACHERGVWEDGESMLAYRRDWQLVALTEWATSPNPCLAADAKSPSADYVIDDSRSPIKPLPSHADVEPYYDEIEAAIGVSGHAGNPAYPPKRSPRLPPLPIARLGAMAASAFNSLGWLWRPSAAAIASAAHKGRPACNAAEPCPIGCPTAAKAATAC